MKSSLVSVTLAAALGAAMFPAPAPVTAPMPPPQDGQQDMAKAMAKAKKYTQPGKFHKHLARFLGKWDTETRLFMGGRAMPPSKGVAETTWLMQGRWLQTRSSGAMMGQPVEAFSMMGYDNFKQSYVVTSVSSMDTAMVRSEGDYDREAKNLLLYGTLDEYLTGEHDKMVKTVLRTISADQYVMEIHDLPIGETDTKVVEISYTRQK